ncbi:MAG: hypothetical protein AAF696_29305, partial [Bacteroidota bacterium]
MHRQTQYTQLLRGICFISLLLLLLPSCNFKTEGKVENEPLLLDPYETWSQKVDSLIKLGSYKAAKQEILQFYQNEDN